MSYFNAKHDYIKKVIVGKTIKSLKDTEGRTTMWFTDGTGLCFFPHIENRRKPCGCRDEHFAVIIANGVHADGAAIQTTELEGKRKGKR